MKKDYVFSDTLEPITISSIRSAVEMRRIGDDVVLWPGNEVQVLDTDGQALWSVEFSKSITGVATRGDKVVCAAGVLAAFRRPRNY